MNFVFLVTGVCVLGVAGLELELVELAWSVRLCFCCVRGASVSVVEAGGSLDGVAGVAVVPLGGNCFVYSAARISSIFRTSASIPAINLIAISCWSNSVPCTKSRVDHMVLERV